MTGVIVIRTFSKAFGLAGARVGYAIADAGHGCRAQPAAVAAGRLDAVGVARRWPRSARRPTSSRLLEERERLAAGARALGLEPWPSRANFLFVPFRRPGRARGDRSFAMGSWSACSRTASRISIRDSARTTISLLESLARALERPNRSRPRPAVAFASRPRDGGDAVSRPARARRRGPRPRLRPAPGSTTTSSSSWRSMRVSTSCSRGRAISRRASITRPRTRRSLSARRSTEPWVTARGIARYGDAVVPDGRCACARVDRPRRSPVVRVQARARARARRPRAPEPRAGRPPRAASWRRPARDAHHVAEAAFKAVGRALRVALRSRASASRRRRACCEPTPPAPIASAATPRLLPRSAYRGAAHEMRAPRDRGVSEE